jgi:uncharacterized protein (DUF1501 family)
MAWRAITEADISTRISASELAGIRSRAGAGSVLADSTALVTERVRGHVAAHAANRVGPAGTVPERLIGAATALLVVDLYSRTAGMLIDLSETRKEAAKSAETLLRDVSRGAFAVEQPDAGTESSEDAKSAAAELVTRSERPLLRDDLSGL